jgi:hypothetical protein
LGGTNLVADKVYATQGAIVNIINPSVLTLTGLQVNTEIRVYEAGTITEIAGVENSGTVEAFDLLGVNAVDIVILALEFEYLRLEDVPTTSDITLPIQQLPDRNYGNP